ncbi:MAG TPA: hypothetical protein VNS63_02570 [Blastocatellia bacterium]|nr:hypothetical protein [Blastocatellia bacterium]
MVNSKKTLINLAIVLSISAVGAFLMTGLDFGGTRWIKFVGYSIFFASIVSPSVLFPSSSCSFMSSLRRRS